MGSGGSGGKVKLAKRKSDPNTFIVVKKTRYVAKELEQLKEDASDQAYVNALYAQVTNHRRGEYNKLYQQRVALVTAKFAEPTFKIDLSDEEKKVQAHFAGIKAIRGYAESTESPGTKKEAAQQAASAAERVEKDARKKLDNARKEYAFHKEKLATKLDLQGLYVPVEAAAENKLLKTGSSLTEKETFYQFMELSDLGSGKNLMQLIGVAIQAGKLTSAEKNILMLHITESLLKIMAAFHTKGICHRDLKAENFLISSDGTIKLADFGSALAMEKNADGSSKLIEVSNESDTRYFPPEFKSPQRMTEERWKKADTWCLGLAAIEFMVGGNYNDYYNPYRVADKNALNAELQLYRDEYPWMKRFIEDTFLTENLDQRASPQAVYENFKQAVQQRAPELRGYQGSDKHKGEIKNIFNKLQGKELALAQVVQPVQPILPSNYSSVVTVPSHENQHSPVISMPFSAPSHYTAVAPKSEPASTNINLFSDVNTHVNSLGLVTELSEEEPEMAPEMVTALEGLAGACGRVVQLLNQANALLEAAKQQQEAKSSHLTSSHASLFAHPTVDGVNTKGSHPILPSSVKKT